MQKLVFGGWLCTLALLLLACNAENNEWKQKVTAVCNCFQPVLEYELALQQAIQSEDVERLEELMLQESTLKKRIRECDRQWQHLLASDSTGVRTVPYYKYLERECLDVSIRLQRFHDANSY